MQVEALKPQSQVEVRTAGFKIKEPYVPGASLRLQDLTTLANKSFSPLRRWRRLEDGAVSYVIYM